MKKFHYPGVLIGLLLIVGCSFHNPFIDSNFDEPKSTPLGSDGLTPTPVTTPVSTAVTESTPSPTPDKQPPSVVSVIPTDGLTNVPIDTVITIRFNESIDPQSAGSISLASHSLTLVKDTNCSITYITTQYTNDTAVITPTDGLLLSATYGNITITGFNDAAGNTMTAYTDSQYSFMTGTEQSPQVDSVAFSSLDNGKILHDSDILIYFDTALDNTITGQLSFGIPSVTYIHGTNADMTFSTDTSGNTIVTINPYADLEDSTSYTNVTINGFTSTSGVTMNIYNDNNYTMDTVDLSGPEILTVNPALDGINVTLDTTIRITFNETLSTTTFGTVQILSHSLVFTHGLNANFTFATDTVTNDTLVIDPDTSLLSSVTYTGLTITGFVDSSDNVMSDYTDTAYNFRTLDNIKPTIVEISPLDNATDIPLNTTFSIRFSESLEVTNIGTLAFSNPAVSFTGTQVSFIKSIYENDTVVVTPASDLLEKTTYADITVSGFTDTTGNVMTVYNDTGYSITTSDTSAPFIEEIIAPADGAVNVATDTTITIRFNESMNTAVKGTLTLNSGVFSLEDGSTASFVFSDTNFVNDTVTITPTSALDEETIYSVLNIAGFENPAGLSMIIYNDSGYTFTTRDETSPTILSVSPATSTTNVATNSNIVVVFNESLDNTVKGSVNISTPSLIAGTSDISFTTTTVSNDTIVINYPGNLAEETVHTGISISGFQDVAGNGMILYTDGGYTFTTADETGPLVTAYSPTDGSTDVLRTESLYITFNESLKTDAYGTVTFTDPVITFTNGSTATITFTQTILENDTVKIVPTTPLTNEYFYSEITITGFQDASGNPMNTHTDTTYNFTTIDTEKPTVLQINSPAKDASDIATSTSITVVFSETLDTGTIGQISFASPSTTTFTQGSTGSYSFTATNKTDDTVVLTPTAALDDQTVYSDITISGFSDDSGNVMTADNDTTYNFTTADETGPVINTLSPVNTATGVGVNDNLVITFDETVSISTGNIYLRLTSDDSLVETIDVTGLNVSGDGTTTITIDPTVTFTSETGYYVEIDSTCFLDQYSNNFAGITGSGTWSFTSVDTAPPEISALSPLDEATNVSYTANLVITFDEVVYVQTGSIDIYRNPGDSLFESIPVDDVRVTGSGTDTITINPTADFEDSTSYYIQIDPNTFADADGNNFTGIGDTSTWNIGVIDLEPPVISSLTPLDNATDIHVLQNLILSFAAGETISSGPAGKYIHIKRYDDDTIFESIEVTNEIRVTVGSSSVTVAPTVQLENYTHYYVQVDAGFVKDAAGNDLTAITNKDDWDFTTKDTVVPSVDSIASPTDGSTDVATTAKLIIVFSESLDTSYAAATGGTVRVNGTDYIKDGTCSLTFSTTNVANDTITIDPYNPWTGATTHTGITVIGFKDEYGNTMTPYSDGVYEFTTQ